MRSVHIFEGLDVRIGIGSSGCAPAMYVYIACVRLYDLLSALLASSWRCLDLMFQLHTSYPIILLVLVLDVPCERELRVNE